MKAFKFFHPVAGKEIVLFSQTKGSNLDSDVSDLCWVSLTLHVKTTACRLIKKNIAKTLGDLVT